LDGIIHKGQWPKVQGSILAMLGSARSYSNHLQYEP
jgi:hypothetical protein